MTKWILIVLCALLGILQLRLWAGEGSLKNVLRLKQIITLQSQDIEQLTVRNKRLDAEVQALKTHPTAMEERARSELGMIKEGETFCVIVEPLR
jgi:cell division protein FtsB